MKKTPHRVLLHVKQPSLAEPTVGDRVQLDRVVSSPDGFLAERHGRLLYPGVTALALAQGHYFFKTLAPANLKVVQGGVDADASIINHKDGSPQQPTPLAGEPPGPGGRGDELSGDPPPFTIEC
jgi:hypothetical protein